MPKFQIADGLSHCLLSHALKLYMVSRYIKAQTKGVGTLWFDEFIWLFHTGLIWLPVIQKTKNLISERSLFPQNFVKMTLEVGVLSFPSFPV